MTRIYFDLSMSLDGFVTGPGEGVEKPLGDGGDRLHDWMFGGKSDTDAEVLAEVYARTGAIVIGKRMFDVGVEPWGDPPPFHMPVFVITHESRAALPMKGGTTYRFVSDGLEAALRQAKSAAGEKDVGIWGGASVVRQYLAAGLLDEFEIHLVPVLLGEGVRLFEWLGSEPIELERTRTIPTPSATHLRFSVKG
jgi:dihydrofolate reductase